MPALIIVGLIAAFAALGLVASRWGVDSRENFSDAYRTVGPIGFH